MSYNIWVKNDKGAFILGEGLVPIMLSNKVDTADWVNPVYVSKPDSPDHLPMWNIGGNVNQFCFKGGAAVYAGGDNYANCSPIGASFNNESNIGTCTVRYIASGDAVTYPSGGMGIVIKDANGNTTYHSSAFLFQPDDIIVARKGQTVSFPVGKWLCPLVWFSQLSPNGFDGHGTLTRRGSTAVWDCSITDGASPVFGDVPNGTIIGVAAVVSI